MYLTIDNIKYKILTTFYSNKTKKNYIVFTDNTEDDLDKANIYAKIYQKGNKLYDINDEDYEEIDNIIKKLMEK